MLDFNFDQNALCGVPLGSPVADLSGLGPADDKRSARQGLFKYRALGLELGAEDGRLSKVTLIWVDTLKEGYQSFAGACRRRAHALGFSAASTEAAVTRALGQPTSREEKRDDETNALEEVGLCYSHSGVVWEVCLGERGTLLEITVRKQDRPTERRD